MNPSPSRILVDPEVSRIKLDREVQKLLAIKEDLRKRGWIIEKKEYPLVRVTFISRHVLPRLAICTVDMDFTNYDVVPPSVRFLDPFSLKPAIYGTYEQMPPHDIRSLIKGTYFKDGKIFDIVLNHPEDGMAFLCMPGVREYHSHPQHTDDPWQNHRAELSGNILHYLLERIDSYCVEPVKALVITVNIGAKALIVGHSYENGQ